MTWLKQLQLVAEQTHLKDDEKILVEKAKEYWLKAHPDDQEGADLAGKGALVAYHLNLRDSAFIAYIPEEGEEEDPEIAKEVFIDCSAAEGAEFVQPYRLHGMKFALGFMKYKNEEDAAMIAFPEGEAPTEEYCQRMFHGEDAPTEYDNDECVDCTCFDCKYMPPGSKENFEQDEVDSMFPDGVDDGFDWTLED